MTVSMVKKSHATIPAACVRRNVVHDSAVRPGAGSMPAFLSRDIGGVSMLHQQRGGCHAVPDSDRADSVRRSHGHSARRRSSGCQIQGEFEKPYAYVGNWTTTDTQIEGALSRAEHRRAAKPTRR